MTVSSFPPAAAGPAAAEGAPPRAGRCLPRLPPPRRAPRRPAGGPCSQKLAAVRSPRSLPGQLFRGDSRWSNQARHLPRFNGPGKRQRDLSAPRRGLSPPPVPPPPPLLACLRGGRPDTEMRVAAPFRPARRADALADPPISRAEAKKSKTFEPVVLGKDGRIVGGPRKLSDVVADALQRWYREAEEDARAGDVVRPAERTEMRAIGRGDRAHGRRSGRRRAASRRPGLGRGAEEPRSRPHMTGRHGEAEGGGRERGGRGGGERGEGRGRAGRVVGGERQKGEGEESGGRGEAEGGGRGEWRAGRGERGRRVVSLFGRLSGAQCAFSPLLPLTNFPPFLSFLSTAQKAAALLGNMMIQGYGCKADPERGRVWVEKARRKGYRMQGVYCEI